MTAPFDGKPLGRLSQTQPGAVQGTVATARQGYDAWHRLPAFERADVLSRAALGMEGEAEALAMMLAQESGKVIRQARLEVHGAIALLRGNTERARSLEGRFLAMQALEQTHQDVGWVERVPLGVVAVILPFNFPVELFAEKVGAALSVGNSVVVKPPPQDPLTVMRVVELMLKAGVPQEVLQVVNGGAEIASVLVTAPDVSAISLTGSTEAGISVAGSSARLLPRLHLELGGNDPAIVLDDADLELAVAELVPGRILMNGQSCAANKRLLVHTKVLDDFLSLLTAAVGRVRLGDPLDSESDMGPLIDLTAAARVADQISRAATEGATLLKGTGRPVGAMIEPHILANVPTDAAVARDDEIFGPVFAVIPVDSAEEAIQVANSSRFGLMGSVFGRDVARTLWVAEQLEAGGVVVNGSGNYRPPTVPFGGVKMSGTGREGLGYTIEELTRPKFTVLRRIRIGNSS